MILVLLNYQAQRRIQIRDIDMVRDNDMPISKNSPNPNLRVI